MAALFVLMGSAFSFAAVGSKHENKAPTVSSSENENEAPEADEPKDESQSQDQSGDHERKQNHGFFVSSAAHCEDVDDPNPDNPDFTAPDDCADNGQAHGEYVKSVAHSSAGKPDNSQSGEHNSGGE
jgi:hypothetical protein